MVQPRARPTGSITPDVDPNGCHVCGAVTRDHYALCYCCATLVGQLQAPLAPLVAMVDYRVTDRTHRRLRGYKDAPVAEARQMYLGQLGRFVDDWITTNGRVMGRRFGSWDLVATVPSSRRPGAAPVEAIVARSAELHRRHRSLLVRGPVPTGHLVAHHRGFSPAPGLDVDRLGGRRVLVVEDSVTTGARAQSAAAALRRAGVRVAGILAIGRALTPGGSHSVGGAEGE